MPQELINIYNSLSEEKQREALNFVMYLKFSESNSLKKNAGNAKQDDTPEIVSLMKNISDKAARDGISEMPIEEIDAEIAEVRKERRERKTAPFGV